MNTLRQTRENDELRRQFYWVRGVWWSLSSCFRGGKKLSPKVAKCLQTLSSVAESNWKPSQLLFSGEERGLNANIPLHLNSNRISLIPFRLGSGWSKHANISPYRRHKKGLFHRFTQGKHISMFLEKFIHITLLLFRFHLNLIPVRWPESRRFTESRVKSRPDCGVRCKFASIIGWN